MPFVDKLLHPFGARALNPDQLNEMLHFAMESYEKLQALYEN